MPQLELESERPGPRKSQPESPKASPGPAARPVLEQNELFAGDDDDELKSAFDRLQDDSSANGSSPGSLEDDETTKAHNRDLFRELAIAHAAPLRDFMLELGVGPTTKRWLDIVGPAITNIKKGADELGQASLSAALEKLREALEQAAKTPGVSIGGNARTTVLEKYKKLARELPRAFDTKGERDRREPIVVHHLLLQVPGVQKVTIDKLYSAGLTSLDAYCRSKPDEIAALAGIDRNRAQAIAERFRTYWRDRSEQPLENGQVKRRLETMLEELERAHKAFQRAEAEEDANRKRRARQQRRAHLLQLNVLLAQLGAVDVVSELERSPTDGKLDRVRQYIQQSCSPAQV